MRITANHNIAGFPAIQIRQLMRETVGRSITLRYVREILRCSDSAATRVLNRLQKDGFVEPVRGHLEPSTKGKRARDGYCGSASAARDGCAPNRRSNRACRCNKRR